MTVVGSYGYVVRIEMAVGSYLSLTEDLTGFQVQRGLGVWPNGITAGTADIELEDSSGVWSPYVSSRHLGKLWPQTPIDILGWHHDTFTGVTSSYYLFRGRIDTVSVNPTLDGGRAVSISARDLWLDFSRRNVRTGMLQNWTVRSAMVEALKAASFAVTAYSLDPISDSLPFVWFNDLTMATVAGEFVDAGYPAYVSRDGVFRMRDRFFDIGGTVVASYDNSGYGLTLAVDGESVINRVTVNGTQRVVSSTQVIAALGQVLAIPVGTYAEFWLNYRDPRGNDRVPATNVVAPVPTTDYLAFQNSAGTGSNMTTAMSLTVSIFAESTKLIVRNTGAGTAHLTKMQLRGQPVFDLAGVAAEVEVASSQARYGLQDAVIESRILGTLDLVKSRAEHIAAIWPDPLPEVTFRIVNDIPSVFHLDVADVVEVREAHSNLSNQFAILELGHTVRASESGWAHETEMRLQRVRAVDMFILDVSSLDNNRLGF